MSGFAVFSLKYPSLLQFDQGREDDLVRANLNPCMALTARHRILIYGNDWIMSPLSFAPVI